MDKYKQLQQRESDFMTGRPVDEGRKRRKVRKLNEFTKSNNDDSSCRNSNYTSSSLRKQPQPYGKIGEGSRSRLLPTGLHSQTNDSLYKTSATSPRLPPQRPVDKKKAVNWRLACFMANEYLTHGTLLGRPWPPQDSNPKCGHENKYKSKPKSAALDKDDDEMRREKERVYHTLTDFLRAGDVQLPGIVNPSQLASWVGLNE